MGSSRRFCGAVAIAASLSITIALLWFVLAVLALLLHSCVIEVDPSRMIYLLILVYFYNEECAPSWAALSAPPPPTQRTLGVAVWQLVASVARVAAGVWLLLALLRAGRSGKGPGGVPRVFWAWAGLCAACLIADVVCAFLYIPDFQADDSLSYLLDETVVLPGDYDYTGISVLPLIMVTFCLRWGALWFLEAINLSAAIMSYRKDRKHWAWLFKRPTASDVANARGGGGDVGDGGGGSGGGGGGGGGDVARGSGSTGGVDVIRRVSPVPPRTINEYDEPYRGPSDHQEGAAYLSVPVYAQVRQGAPAEAMYQNAHPARPRPGRAAPPPPLQGIARAQAAALQGPPSPARMGDWDPRSPLPPPAHLWPPRQEPARAPAPLLPEEERRYISKLKDKEAERLRRQEQQQWEQRERERERERERLERELDEERRLRDLAMQEVAQLAEEKRRRRAEAAVEEAARRAKKSEKEKAGKAGGGAQLWSYLAPPRDALPERQAERGGGGGGGSEGSDDYDERPPVPVPDYTWHFKRPNERPTLDQLE